MIFDILCYAAAQIKAIGLPQKYYLQLNYYYYSSYFLTQCSVTAFMLGNSAIYFNSRLAFVCLYQFLFYNKLLL
jgi:hypothetical protein